MYWGVYVILLTHWGRVTHICVSKLTTIGSDNGLAPHRHQAIIWTNAGILLIGPLRTNFIEIFIEIYIFSFKKMHLKLSSVKRRPFCLGLNVLMIRQHSFRHQRATLRTNWVNWLVCWRIMAFHSLANVKSQFDSYSGKVHVSIGWFQITV